ncbi:MAG TPA: glycosyltransferase family 4 protein [Nevskiaceae bacterium]|nr:glycosyltransferase family 4 protein [Nevskiaceae bacterium]
MGLTYKIGLVLDDSLDSTDGVQQYVLTMGKWLAAMGHDVHYLVGQTTRTDIPNVHSLSRNMNVRFNGNRMSMPMPANKQAIRQLLAREQFDVLHVQMPYSPFLAGRIIGAAGPKTAVVGTFHILPNSSLAGLGTQLLGRVLHGSLKRFDQIMSVSAAAADFAKSSFGIDSQVVPNTADLTPFFNAKPFAAYNVPTIVFLGRLVPRKGAGHLLHAIARMERKDPFKVVICGGGPLDGELKNFVRQQKLGDIVEFTGKVTEADKPRYLASADIAIYPSTGGESFGIVLLEAMAAAHGAVLAGNNPGYASVMGEHDEALFNPKDEAALAVRLTALLHDKTAREEAQSWQQHYVRQFDVPTVGAQLLGVYADALHKRRA